MLEGKTANNIVDRYHRIITGDQNQIEVSPNRVVTVTGGNIGNPFEGATTSVDPAELYELLTPSGEGGEAKTQASAIIYFSTGETLQLNVFAYNNALVAQAFTVSGDNSQITSGIYLNWSKTTGDLTVADSITNGAISDIKSIIKNVSCYLTVIYHPLPEE